jgi:hypothetical protein
LEQKIKAGAADLWSASAQSTVSLRTDVENLQEALNVERWAFVLVQLLFAGIILLLVADLAMRGDAFPVQAGIGGGIALATVAGLFVARRPLGLSPRFVAYPD